MESLAEQWYAKHLKKQEERRQRALETAHKKLIGKYGSLEEAARAREARVEKVISRRQRIVDMRRGGMTLQEIGDEIGITRERVRQILLVALSPEEMAKLGEMWEKRHAPIKDSCYICGKELSIPKHRYRGKGKKFRYHNDPAYARRQNLAATKYWRKKQHDPEYRRKALLYVHRYHWKKKGLPLPPHLLLDSEK